MRKTFGIAFALLAGIALSKLSWFPAPNTSDFGLYFLVISNVVLSIIFLKTSHSK